MKVINKSFNEVKQNIINTLTELVNNGVISEIYLNEKLIPAINNINESSNNAIEHFLKLLKGQTDLLGKRNLVFIVSQHLKDCEESYNSFFNQQRYQAITKSCKDFLQIIHQLEDSIQQSLKTNKVEISFKNS